MTNTPQQIAMYRLANFRRQRKSGHTNLPPQSSSDMRSISQTTTGCPQIVTLEGSSGSVKHRRLRRRIRYPHRTAHARLLQNLPRLRLGVLNTQGWAWHRLGTNNVDTADDIVQIARAQGLDFLALPDTLGSYMGKRQSQAWTRPHTERQHQKRHHRLRRIHDYYS